MDKNVLYGERIGKHTETVKNVVDYINGAVDEASWVEKNCFASFDGKGNDGDVVIGSARVYGVPVELACFNVNVNQGGFGKNSAYRFTTAMKNACGGQIPFVSVIDSCGANVLEGSGVLAYFADLIAEAQELRRSGVPHICVIRGNCYGIMVQFAAIADAVIVDEDCTVCFGSPAVTLSKENKVYEPKKYFGAANCKKSGLATLSAKKGDLRNVLGRLLSYISVYESDCVKEVNIDENNFELQGAESMGYDELVKSVSDDDSVLELYSGVRCAIRTYFARIGGNAVGIFASDRDNKNLDKTSLDKLAGFLRLANDFEIPTVAIVDCEGLKGSIEVEQSEIWRSVRAVTDAYYCFDSCASMPRIALITGSAVGLGYSLLVGKPDCGAVIAWADSYIAPISASAGAQLKYSDRIKDAKTAERVRKEIEITYKEVDGDAYNSACCGLVNYVIKPCDTKQYLFMVLEQSVKR
ncbi:MAG: carboxyl transferase domain-containing protein [Clostridia bacterium]|nr:carboxyl transferase domain-containing protein [Clostridia bacterium]